MANKKSVLEVVIDSTGAKAGADAVIAAFDRMRRAASSTTDAVSKMTSNSASSAFKSMSKAASSISNSWRTMRKAVSDSIDAIGKKIHSISKFAKGIEKVFSGTKGAIAGAVTGGILKLLVDTGLKMQKFRTTLTVITGNVGDANKELAWLKETVDRVGISFEQAAAPFARFAAAAAEILDPNEIRNVFSAFSEASAALHLNQQEINGVYLALQQMASKGKVSMEELRLQLAERIPGAMRIAADTMNMSVGELEDAIRKRLIASEDFLGKFADGIHAKFGAAAETASRTALGAFARFKNELFATGTAIAEAGLLDAVSNAADRLALFLKNNQDTVKQIGESLGMMVAKATDFVTSLKPEDVKRFFETVNTYAKATFEWFEKIANSRFMQFMARSDEEWQAIDQLQKMTDKMKNLYENYEKYKQDYGKDSAIVKTTKQEIASLAQARTALTAYLDELRGAPKFVPPTTDDVVDQLTGKSTVSPVADEDYKEQLQTIQMSIEKIRDKNYELNELVAHRKSLTTEMIDLQKKMNGEDEYATLSYKDRVQAAIRYKGHLITVKELTEDIGKFNNKSVTSVNKMVKSTESLLFMSRRVGELEKTTLEAHQNRISLVDDHEKELFKLRMAREKALFDLTERYKSKMVDIKGDPQKVKELTAAYVDAGIKIGQSFDNMRESAIETNEVMTSWQHGAKTALDEYSDSVKDAATITKNLMTGAFQTMEDAIVDFVMTGKFSFSDFARSIIADIVRIQAQQLVTNMASSFLGFLPFAKGGTFTNSIVNEPTLFKFASGTGMMGEAGPEAIVPLARTASGDLGVKTVSGGESGGSKVTVNIVNNAGVEVTTRENIRGDNTIIDVMVERVKSSVANDIARGDGQVPAALTHTYGLNRVAGAY